MLRFNLKALLDSHLNKRELVPLSIATFTYWMSFQKLYLFKKKKILMLNSI